MVVARLVSTSNPCKTSFRFDGRGESEFTATPFGLWMDPLRTMYHRIIRSNLVWTVSGKGEKPYKGL